MEIFNNLFIIINILKFIILLNILKYTLFKQFNKLTYLDTKKTDSQNAHPTV